MTTSDRKRPLSESEARRLGEWMARELGEGPSAEVIATQRLRLARATSVSAPPAPLRARLWAVGGGILAAAVVVGGIVVVGKLQSSSSATARRPGISAEPLAAHHGQAESNPAEAPRSVFTWRVSKAGASAADQLSGIVPEQRLDATNGPVLLELGERDRPTVGRVEFGVGARVSVVRVDASELAVKLDHGIVETALSPRASRVLVQAGPYLVRPLGLAEPGAPSGEPSEAEPVAAYGVQWAPRAGALRVEVTRGEVEVVVAASSERHVIAAGKSLNLVAPDAAEAHPPRVSKADRKSRSAAHAENAAPTSLRPVEEKPTAAGVEQAVEAPAAAGAAAPAELGRWRKLAENGQYAAAVKEAEQVGFGTLEQNASASDLLLLADVARLGGAPQRARSVLTSLRSRYPGHTNSAVAAFTLGRMAQEQEHDDRRAIQWYRTYLKEEPRGRMSEGARARLLKATLRVGSGAERDQAARDYLDNHPTGSSAAVARSVLSN